MKMSQLNVTKVVLVLVIVVPAGSLLVAIAGSNGSRSTSIVALGPTPNLKVGPQLTTNVQMIYDSDDRGLGGPADMVGPVIGTVSYRQGSDGRLILVLHADFAQPNTTYQIFPTCGPSHDLGCGFTEKGKLTTNAVGTGTESLVLPLSTLQAPPFGCGYRTDHIDILVGLGDFSKGVLVAGAINYFVPCAPGSVPTAPSGHGDATGM